MARDRERTYSESENLSALDKEYVLDEQDERRAPAWAQRMEEEKNASRWLEITQTEPGEIELDKIHLTGPNIAWTIDELNAQGYYLDKAIHSGASLTGENCSGNHFRFQARNVKAFTCRLHPQMADLSQPIHAEVNGTIQECLPEPDDSHRDYQARITLTVE